MKEQQRAQAVVETVPEDPSRPDGATDIYLMFDGRRIARRHDLDIVRTRSSGA